MSLNAYRIEICAKLRVREPTSSCESLLPSSTLGKEDGADHDILQRRAADWSVSNPSTAHRGPRDPAGSCTWISA